MSSRLSRATSKVTLLGLVGHVGRKVSLMIYRDVPNLVTCAGKAGKLSHPQCHRAWDGSHKLVHSMYVVRICGSHYWTYYQVHQAMPQEVAKATLDRCADSDDLDIRHGFLILSEGRPRPQGLCKDRLLYLPWPQRAPCICANAGQIPALT